MRMGFVCLHFATIVTAGIATPGIVVGLCVGTAARDALQASLTRDSGGCGWSEPNGSCVVQRNGEE